MASLMSAIAHKCSSCSSNTNNNAALRRKVAELSHIQLCCRIEAKAGAIFLLVHEEALRKRTLHAGAVSRSMSPRYSFDGIRGL